MYEGHYRILTINPGSTTTKIAIYQDEEPLIVKTISHSRVELDLCGVILDQRSLREQAVWDAMKEADIDPATLDAVVGRGGLIRPIDSGVYTINPTMLHDLEDAAAATHASTLGAIIAYAIATELHLPAYVVDPIVVDELDPFAKLTGFPGIERQSIFHALNQKAIARRCAREMGVLYENSRFIVAHMGGGITVGAHRYGRVIDVNDALAGEGPFTPERTGAVPLLPLIDLCYSGAYTHDEMVELITKRGGMMAYLGTNDLRKCLRMVKEGDEYATLVFESMAYQVSKEIGAMAAVLEGRVDAIILTGGLAHSVRFTGAIKERVDLIAPVKVFPGEDELLALAEGALRVLRGEEQPLTYDGV